MSCLVSPRYDQISKGGPRHRGTMFIQPESSVPSPAPSGDAFSSNLGLSCSRPGGKLVYVF